MGFRMTLVLSEAFKYGIVMVADSAITTDITRLTLPSGKPVQTHVRTGAEKIRAVPNKPIGISAWGMGRIGEIPTDLWLDDFLGTKIHNSDNIETICNKLADAVNEDFFIHKQNDLGGFHVGAILGSTTEQPLPVLYHIHRGHEGEPPGKFQLYKDYPVDQGWSVETYQQHLDHGMSCYLRNGHHSKFAYLHASIVNYINDLASKGVNIPSPNNLRSHERLNRLLVGVMCDIYSMSDKPASVARPISSLTIDLKGNLNYTSPLSDVSYV